MILQTPGILKVEKSNNSGNIPKKLSELKKGDLFLQQDIIGCCGFFESGVEVSDFVPPRFVYVLGDYEPTINHYACYRLRDDGRVHFLHADKQVFVGFKCGNK